MSEEIVNKIVTLADVTVKVTARELLVALGYNPVQVDEGAMYVVHALVKREGKVENLALTEPVLPRKREGKIEEPAHVRVNGQVRQTKDWIEELKLPDHASFKALVEEGKFRQLSAEEGLRTKRERGDAGNPRYYERVVR